MKTKTLVLLSALFHVACFLNAQNAQIENLTKLVDESEGEVRINACSEISFHYLRLDPLKGIYYAKLALELADSLNIPTAKSKAWNSLGANYLSTGIHDSARISFHKAVHFATEHKDTLELATAFNRLGVLFEKNGLFDSALIVFHKALEQYTLLEKIERVGLVNENIGMIHLHRGELKTALVFLLEAESDFNRIGSKAKLASVYLKIGRVYSETGEYVTAEKWLRKGKLIAIEAGDFHTAGVATNVLGIMYKKQNRLEDALTNYQELIEIGEKINNNSLLFAAYNNIGNVYHNLEEYKKALNYHQQALVFAKDLNNPILLAEQYVNTANTYNALKVYSEALSLFEQALPIFTSSGSWSSLLATYQGLIMVNNGLKNYGQSVNYYEKYISVKDSLNRNELNTALDSLKVKFNTEQTIQENTLLAQKNEIQDKTISLQRNMIVSAIIIAVLLVGFILMIFRNRQKIRRANILLEEKNQEISEKAEALKQSNQTLTELSQFKDSMQSFLVHDLKNALNIIINSDLRSDPEQKVQGIRSAGKRMLNMVHNMLDITGFENNRMSLNTREISHKELVENACRQMKMQAATRNITLSFNQDYDYHLLADYDITERVLLNLLDNAIRHSSEDSNIEVGAAILDGFLRIAVKDQGVGIPPDLLPFIFEKYTRGSHASHGNQRSYGLGLAFCKMAIETHGGKIGAISEQGKGSEIWFTLTLISTNVVDTTFQARASLTSDQRELPELTEYELNYIRENYGQIGHFSIHQISDINDLLNKPDEITSAGIDHWKKAVITSTNQYNSLLFNQLVKLITKNNV